MTISSSTSYVITTGECITRAFEEIGILGEGDELSPYDYGVAKNTLNLMIKALQNRAEHLWVRQKVVLFLQKLQPTYTFSTTTTDHITADTLAATTLGAAAAISDVTITVASSSGFHINDKIGIQLDNGYFFWSTVDGILSPTSIQIHDAFTSTAAIGLYVFGYTNQITTIFNPYSATRRLITSNIDVPLIQQSYVDYTRMPNKLSPGTPNMWSYDRQQDSTLINIWQNPADVSYYLNFVVDRRIHDVDVNSSNLDFPQEWGLTIQKNLAVLLAPGYGKAQGDNFAELKAQAQENLVRSLENDNELGSSFFVPSRSGIRGG